MPSGPAYSDLAAGAAGTSTTTGLQTARLNQNGVASTCTALKPFPGVFGTGTRRFDAFTTETCSESAPSCIAVALAGTPTGGNPALFASAYKPTFDPDGDTLTITQSPAGPYPLGATTVLPTVTDPKGATSQATGTVTVVDTTAPDWVIVDAHRLQLRAERSGNGTGRTYTITLTCTDAAGNASVRTASVRVPHSQGR